jgi:integrase
MGRTGSGVEVRENSLRIQFVLDGRTVRRTLVVADEPMSPTPSNIKYARRLVAEIRDKIRLGNFSIAEYFPATGNVGHPTTLGDQLDTWLDSKRLEASTRAGYESAIKFWKGAAVGKQAIAMGEKALRALKPSDIMTVLAARSELTGKTVNNYVSVLREALDLAVIDKVLTGNPADSIARAKYQKPLPDPFTREEVERIIAHMAQHYPDQVVNYVEFKFFTGLRTSESFGLRWRNVDLPSKQILVTQAIVRGIEKDNTKTNTARHVALNSRSLTALQRQRKHTQVAGAHVFLDPRYGTAWLEERAFRRSFWEPTLKHLAIRYRPPYNTRHSYATMMLMAGMWPAFCARQLGHSVEMFLRTYSKWLDGDQNALEMNRLETALGANSSLEHPQDGGEPR